MNSKYKKDLPHLCLNKNAPYREHCYQSKLESNVNNYEGRTEYIRNQLTLLLLLRKKISFKTHYVFTLFKNNTFHNNSLHKSYAPILPISSFHEIS